MTQTEDDEQGALPAEDEEVGADSGEDRTRLGKAVDTVVKSPAAGTIERILVSQGQTVIREDVLMVLQIAGSGRVAFFQNIEAAQGGSVVSILVRLGQHVAAEESVAVIQHRSSIVGNRAPH